MLTRRGLIGGLIAAPAIVAIGSLMPIRGIVMAVEPRWHHFRFDHGADKILRIFVDGLEHYEVLPVHPEVTRRYGWTEPPVEGSLSYWANDSLLDELHLRVMP
jgi:hypothetical protein